MSKTSVLDVYGCLDHELVSPLLNRYLMHLSHTENPKICPRLVQVQFDAFELKYDDLAKRPVDSITPEILQLLFVDELKKEVPFFACEDELEQYLRGEICGSFEAGSTDYKSLFALVILRSETQKKGLSEVLGEVQGEYGVTIKRGSEFLATIV